MRGWRCLLLDVARGGRAWYTPQWRAKAKETFCAEPVITYYETYVTVDNVKGETIVRES